MIAAGMALGGCVAGGSWVGVLLALVAGVGGLAGCDRSTPQQCCVNQRITVCACPANAICNFAGFTNNGDGTCSLVGAGQDSGTLDGQSASSDGGSWQPCCGSDGHLASCFCPVSSSCNFGLGLTVCPDGTCGYGRATLSCTADAGVDASVDGAEGGASYPCCTNGRVATCYCPPGTACNYAPYQSCPDGTCYSQPPFSEPDAGDRCGVDAGVE